MQRMIGLRSHAGPAADCNLVPRWSSRLALEMPLQAARSWITRADCFYVFNHTAAPSILISSWRLHIRGQVSRPIDFEMSEVKHLPMVEVINTLECAGNGRAFFDPPIPEVPWQKGALSNGLFRGYRLSDLLAAAKIKRSAAHIAFHGADGTGNQPVFIRSIPIDKALDPNTILAVSMNGKPLSPEHGFPMRAVVPGWIGAASVKRLIAIWALEEEAQGQFMQQAYRLPVPTDAGSTDSVGSQAITALQVKSIITEPGDGERIFLSKIPLRGVAWAGEAAIRSVEVSVDSGATWLCADLKGPTAKYAWRLWEYLWTPPAAGVFEIWARATDVLGRTQPETASWNAHGYLWNGIDRIRLSIV